MKTVWKALLAALALELAAFSFLLFGKWEFMGEVNSAGATGVILHYPGFCVGRLLSGNISWFAIIGVPLVIWFALAYAACRVIDKVKSRKS